MTTPPPRPGAEAHDDGTLTITFLRDEGEAEAPLTLNKAQVQILYALAESDHGTLPYRSLHEVLRGSPATRFTRETPLPRARRQQLHEKVEALVASGLVVMKEAGEGDPRPGLTPTGRRLITWLTRRWEGWPAYSRRFGLHHF